jgi:hypothetical protein
VLLVSRQAVKKSIVTDDSRWSLEKGRTESSAAFFAILRVISCQLGIGRKTAFAYRDPTADAWAVWRASPTGRSSDPHLVGLHGRMCIPTR